MANGFFNNILSSVFVAVTSLMSTAFFVTIDCCIASSTHDLKTIAMMPPTNIVVRGGLLTLLARQIDATMVQWGGHHMSHDACNVHEEFCTFLEYPR